jgi:hypothetical protein
MTPDPTIEAARAILKGGVPKVFTALCAAATDATATRRDRLTAIVILLEGAERGYWTPDAVSAALEQRGSASQ